MKQWSLLRLAIPLFNILSSHPHAEIVYTYSRRAGAEGNLNDAETVFIALPHGASGEYLQSLKGKRVIDLSIDHRADKDWVYGLPEMNRNEIKDAEKIANPGCYATSIILGMLPLRGFLREVNVASTSGVSGAGLEKREEDNFFIYKEGRKHSHVAEIEKFLGIEGLQFVPQRIDNTDKGIVSTIFAKYDNSLDVRRIYEERYGSEPFVRMVEQIETRNVNGTNRCDIKLIPDKGNLIVVSALDNTLKGGAGQAVQNFNIMYGFDERTGLLY